MKLGANATVDALVKAGVHTFFMNPGTSEVHLVSAIDSHDDARPILCLFEGAATGAADGYARAAGLPAAVLLHLGPGLANGLANLHNASKARSPMIVLVGEHATDHLPYDTPLNSDVNALAGYTAKEVFHLSKGDDIYEIVSAAVKSSTAAPAGPVVIVANVDLMWSVYTKQVPASSFNALPQYSPLDPQKLAAIADALMRSSSESRAALILGGNALCAEGSALADVIAQKTGCTVYCETFNARQERGTGIPPTKRIPYFREKAIDELQDFDKIALIGSRPPVAFFASPDESSLLTAKHTKVITLDEKYSVSPLEALRYLAQKLIEPQRTVDVRYSSRLVSNAPLGKLNAQAIWSALNRHIPSGTMVSEEAGVTSVGADETMQVAESHTWFNLTGGAIGQAIPVATGASLARPDLKAFAMQGDGGAMYTIQALWTQVRERLSVVNVILRNDRYAILDHEIKRHGIAPLSQKGARMFDLTDPTIDWVALASSMGMNARSVTTAEDFDCALAKAIASNGPVLIEARLASGKRAES